MITRLRNGTEDSSVASVVIQVTVPCSCVRRPPVNQPSLVRFVSIHPQGHNDLVSNPGLNGHSIYPVRVQETESLSALLM